MLTGIKVLDLSRILAGPVCSMMLGDMGADVIKIERRGVGDDTRGWGPPFDERGESAYYLSINRNKRSVEVDLADERDRKLLWRLAAEADVVLENFRPGVLERWGLGGEQVRERYPRVVWGRIVGFPGERDRPGYDFVVQAEAGWMAITGEPEGAPMKHGVALVDVLCGRDAAVAILAALVARGATGVGRVVEVSLAGTAQSALVNVAQNVMVSGREAGRWGNAHANLVPYQLFDASDRPLVIAVGTDAQWIACARALGLGALADDPTLATNAGRLARRADVADALIRVVRSAPASHWRAVLDAVGVPCGVVRTVSEVIADVPADVVSGMPPSVPGRVRRPPPRLGEHTEVVRARGWEAEIPR